MPVPNTCKWPPRSQNETTEPDNSCKSKAEKELKPEETGAKEPSGIKVGADENLFLRENPNLLSSLETLRLLGRSQRRDRPNRSSTRRWRNLLIRPGKQRGYGNRRKLKWLPPPCLGVGRLQSPRRLFSIRVWVAVICLWRLSTDVVRLYQAVVSGFETRPCTFIQRSISSLQHRPSESRWR